MRRGKGLSIAAAVLALLLVALLAARSGRPVVEFGPQQHVDTVNPKIGMHTRVTDEVEPWKIQRTFEMVREMGAPWDVEYFLWAATEPQPGVYDWSHADLVVDHAVNQGLTVIARLGYVPEWARPKDATHLYLDEKGYDAFAREPYCVGECASEAEARVALERQRRWLAATQDKTLRDEVWLVPPDKPAGHKAPE